jgi:hypothetical protein
MINNKAKVLKFAGFVARECEAAAVPKGKMFEARVVAERRLHELCEKTRQALRTGNISRYVELRNKVREISPSMSRHL